MATTIVLSEEELIDQIVEVLRHDEELTREIAVKMHLGDDESIDEDDIAEELRDSEGSWLAGIANKVVVPYITFNRQKNTFTQTIEE